VLKGQREPLPPVPPPYSPPKLLIGSLSANTEGTIKKLAAMIVSATLNFIAISPRKVDFFPAEISSVPYSIYIPIYFEK
jgi:hypothetical protein